MLYPLIVFFHSWLRWGVLFLGVLTFWQALMGWARGENVTPEQRHTQLAFVSALDTQVVLGLVLYFVLSPLTPKSLGELQRAMTSTVPRFFAVEHAAGMLAALVIVHLASVLSRRPIHAAARHRRWFFGLLIALVLVVGSTPWPSTPYGRPWIRTFSLLKVH